MIIRKLLHDWLGWGYPCCFIRGNGFQAIYSCRYCVREVTQDSQGNWFHL